MRTELAVRIANGASLSGELFIDRWRIAGIKMPAGWTAAGITFQALIRQDAAGVATFGDVYDQATNEVTIAGPAADRYIVIEEGIAEALRAAGRIKIRSGTSGVPVNQGAQRDFSLVLSD